MSWFINNSEARSSGWSGTEGVAPEFGSEFALGYRAGVSQSLDSLRTWLLLLEDDLASWEKETVSRVRIQTVRQAISELERLL
jgi:hypothetical protein